LCFVLFFWSRSQLSGQILALAILLFVLGLVLIAVEIFVLPGFGFTGVMGILLLLAGIGLAMVERMPQTSSEWLNLGGTMATLGLSMVGASVAAIIIAHYLPNIPLANGMVLRSAADKVEEGEDHPAVAGAADPSLLGAIGTAATMLRPAGMARIGEAYVDVVTDGTFVQAGSRVQVVEIEGNRIVVKEV